VVRRQLAVDPDGSLPVDCVEMKQGARRQIQVGGSQQLTIKEEEEKKGGGGGWGCMRE